MVYITSYVNEKTKNWSINYTAQQKIKILKMHKIRDNGDMKRLPIFEWIL